MSCESEVVWCSVKYDGVGWVSAKSLCRRLRRLLYYIYIGFSFLVQTRNDAIYMDNLSSTRGNVFKLNDDRLPPGFNPLIAW